MRKYRGFEFKRAVTLAIHKVCATLNRPPVDITWGNAPSPCINDRGYIQMPNIRDDAWVTHNDMMRYVGYGVHEILHWVYTDFGATYAGHGHSQYVAQLHNALEDAWIENKAIDNNLTGNITELLSTLIDGISKEGLAHVDDWSNPAQYPFVLAVYARKHATVKVPLAEGLKPIFDGAVTRLNKCKSSHDTLTVAVWVFDQLKKLQPPEPPVQPPPPPPVNPVDTDPEDDGSDASEPPTGGDQEGDAPTPPTNPAKSPVNDKGEIVEATPVEPTVQAPDDCGSGGTYSTADIERDKFHVRRDGERVFPINF